MTGGGICPCEACSGGFMETVRRIVREEVEAQAGAEEGKVLCLGVDVDRGELESLKALLGELTGMADALARRLRELGGAD